MVEDLEVDVASSDFNCMLNANILNGDFSGVLKLVVLHEDTFTKFRVQHHVGSCKSFVYLRR